MKLYTKEQIKQAISLGRIHLLSNNSDEILEQFTPITILSDNEIDKMATEYAQTAIKVDLPYANGLYYGYMKGYKTAIENLSTNTNINPVTNENNA